MILRREGQLTEIADFILYFIIIPIFIFVSVFIIPVVVIFMVLFAITYFRRYNKPSEEKDKIDL
jgi:heme/copper-type cytochrome/quinol oxidase subunit 2